MKAIIITTIQPATEAVKRIAAQCRDWSLVIVGDLKTPKDWEWPGVRFLSIANQMKVAGQLAGECPFNHYARKNLGYIEAIRNGAEVIAETDDDNVPYDCFLRRVNREFSGRAVLRSGWENVYTHFSGERIWPRGFPLDLIRESLQSVSVLGESEVHICPIQQYLADGDPDVDAIYRMTSGGEVRFHPNNIVLPPGCYCPFNSQNTIWWPEAFPLLYLPAYVSFRVTDIWRSLVAQVCVHAMGLSIGFGSATVYQERNGHSLMRDFEDEIAAYLHNGRIVSLLSGLSLSSEPADAGANLSDCYTALVRAGFVPEAELRLVELWLNAVAECCDRREVGIEGQRMETTALSSG